MSGRYQHNFPTTRTAESPVSVSPTGSGRMQPQQGCSPLKGAAAAAAAVCLTYFLLRPSGCPECAARAGPCPTAGQLRAQALAKRGSAAQNVARDSWDAITRADRAAALAHKGATVWLTGLSGSGKSTIGKALERRLVMQDRVHMYRLDGDNLRFGISRDLGLNPEDRTESGRRACEMASLFADAGQLTLVSLISPYRSDRRAARRLHAEMGIPFVEVHVDVSIAEAEQRDPKGLYKKFRRGVFKGMTGIDSPYEVPSRPEVVLRTDSCCGDGAAAASLAGCRRAMPPGSKADEACRRETAGCVDSCVTLLRQELIDRGLVEPRPGGAPAAASAARSGERPPGAGAPPVGPHPDGYPPGHPLPSFLEGDEAYWVSDTVTKLTPVQLRDVDVQWMQVVCEGWAAPLRGPMREAALVQALHFSSLVVDTSGASGAAGASGYGPGPGATDWGATEAAAKLALHGTRVSMPVPIILPVCERTRARIRHAVERAAAVGESARVALVSPAGEPFAVLDNPEVYPFRKEELITRYFGHWDPAHPYVRDVIAPAPGFLVGGELHRCRRIRFRDGLDRYRLTPAELLREFEARGADAVFAFQTRNPTHAGHAHLMKDGRRQLLERGFKNPVLWLSPLGGYTKGDDMPLDARMRQHQAILDEGMLDPHWTVMAIWPSPMLYAGPAEVQWHAKSRRVAAADYFIVGRDPAGLPYSEEYTRAHNLSGFVDVYDFDHGRYVLQMSPGIGSMGFLASSAVHYDKTDGEMRARPPGLSDEEFSRRFLGISGGKMRQMGARGVDLCPSIEQIPPDWSEDPSCVPPKFMSPGGWKVMREYYQSRDDAGARARAVMESKQRPALAPGVAAEHEMQQGLPGGSYAVYLQSSAGKRVSAWHDMDLKAGSLYNMVVEIPKGTTAVFKVQTQLPHNPIRQDTAGDRPLYFTHGLAPFNGGFFPQTWEDSTTRGAEGALGDKGPVDVMEVGSRALPVGAVVRVKLLGILALLGRGVADHKVIVMAADDPDAERVGDMESLGAVKGQPFLDRIRDWLQKYKTTDAADPDLAVESVLGGSFGTAGDAARLVDATHKRWGLLRAGRIESDRTRRLWLGRAAQAGGFP